jgi:hypothetical protein
VRDVVTELRAFAAEITLGCHGIAPIFCRRNSPASNNLLDS